MVQTIFISCMIVLIAIGFHCARHLTSDNPLWVRLIVLAPCLTAFVTLIAISQGIYTAYIPDILRSISVMLIYALVGSRFTDKPWLDIRK